MTVANFKIGTIAFGAGKMIAEGCGCCMVYTSSVSSAEVCDRLCVILSGTLGRKK